MMPTFFGLSAMPTTLLNSAFSLLRDRSVPVRGPDRVAIVSPMYNEEVGAARALASLLAQSCPADEVAVSINGSSDATYDVVAGSLGAHGFVRAGASRLPGASARLERWRCGGAAPAVWVIVYAERTAKSAAVNDIVQSGLLRSERILLVDGDTVLDRDFLRAVKDDFYRLRRRGGKLLVEDYALQSGWATSYLPGGSSRMQRFISRGRAAEYAFSGVVREGQTRQLGRGGLWGESRLYTVVGCGFVARRDALPMPAQTLTEDHDLTLTAQGQPARLERLSPDELTRRGFRIVQQGREVPFSAVVDRHDAVVIRHTGNARFVARARMYTEDPASLGGYFRQVQRWNGGGQQNALRRAFGDAAERRLPANVRFAVFAAQGENLLGLALLALFPIVLALGVAGAIGQGAVLRALALWAGIDVAAGGAMAFAGFYAQARASDRGVAAALRRAARDTLGSWLPFMALKLGNPVSFVAAGTRAVPEFVRARRAAGRSRSGPVRGVAWERPTSSGVDARTLVAAVSMVATVVFVFMGILAFVPGRTAEQRAVERLLRKAPRVDMAAHESLPLTGYGPGPTDLLLSPSASPTLLHASQKLQPVSGVAARARRSDTSSPGAGTGSSAVGSSAAGASTTADGRVGAPLAGAAQGGTAGPAAPLPSRRVLQAPATTVALLRPVPRPSGTPAEARRSLGAPATTVALLRSPHGLVASRAASSSLSAYCRPSYLRRPAPELRVLPGSAEAYRPLDPWELLMLGRLAPIAPLIEEAATAYDVPPELFVQVLINESYLNPLAVGPTDDKGLSQATPAALRLLRAISYDPSSRFYNPHLLEGAYNVFDPDFSICNGAAKLAWALSREGAKTWADAYALYINPVYGLTRGGKIAQDLRKPVAAMERLAPLVRALGDAYAAYRADPSKVAAPERALMEVSAAVASRRMSLAEAYGRSRQLVAADHIDDDAVYRDVLGRLFPGAMAGAPSAPRPSLAGAQASAP